MSITTTNGAVLTDAEMNKIAEMFERREWPKGKTEIVRGRPLLFDEELQSVTFKVPVRKVIAMDQKAATLDMSRSDYLRSLLDNDLATA
jgi:hypothetical protein